MAVLRRNLGKSIAVSLTDSPVVFLQGARQTGKSTLVKSMVQADRKRRYMTLDDAATLAAAQSDPQGFIAGVDAPVVIDEVQRAPGLSLAIKASVDADRKPGRFLLTGSANPMLLPNLSESLAGRIELHTLWPLSQGELAGHAEHFIDAIFAARFTPPDVKGESFSSLIGRLMKGGYPEMLTRVTDDRRRAWVGSYLNTILQRNVRDISNIRDLSELPRLLALIASRAASLLDYSDLARSLSMPQSTLKRYMSLLQATFLIHTLPAWFTNIGKRIAKSPKLLVNDTGLLLHLLGADSDRLKSDPTLGGAVLENFVALELLKQQGWSKLKPNLFHFRTHTGDEVDFVLEHADGRIVGIEVKSTASIDAGHFKGLKVLADAAKDRFVRGIVLYTGSTSVPFSKNLMALPMPALWQ